MNIIDSKADQTVEAKAASAPRYGYKFTGNIPVAPSKNFNGVIRTALGWTKYYMLGVVRNCNEHKMSVVLCTLWVLLSVLPIINILFMLLFMLVMGMFSVYPMGLIMHLQRKKVGHWWDKQALDSFHPPDTWTMIKASLAMSGLWIGCALLMMILVVVLTLLTSSWISLEGSLDQLISKGAWLLVLVFPIGILMMTILMQLAFCMSLLMIPLVIFHRQSVGYSLQLALKASWSHREQLASMGLVSLFITIVLPFIVGLFGITILLSVLILPLMGYWLWVHLHMISQNYKYMLLEYLPMESK